MKMGYLLGSSLSLARGSAVVIAVVCASFAVPTPCPPAHGEQRRRPPGSTTTAGSPRLEVVRAVDTGSQPKSVSVSPDGSRLYVCNFGFRDHDNVWVYDAQSLEHVGTVTFQGNAVETAFSPDGRTLYVSNFRGAKLMVVDVATLQVRGEVDVGSDPKTIVLSPDGSTIYIANYVGGTVSVVDAESLEETRRIQAGTQPRGMVVAADGRLYVASFRDHLTHIFDPRNDYAEESQISMCRFPRHLALSPDDSRLYVSCSSVRAVHWHHVVDGRRTGIVPVGHNPRTIDISDNGRYIAVADFDSSSVSLIDTVAMTHRTNRIQGADRIVGVAIHPGADLRVYATSWNTRRLIVLEPAGDAPPAGTDREPMPPEARPMTNEEIDASTGSGGSGSM